MVCKIKITHVKLRAKLNIGFHRWKLFTEIDFSKNCCLIWSKTRKCNFHWKKSFHGSKRREYVSLNMFHWIWKCLIWFSEVFTETLSLKLFHHCLMFNLGPKISVKVLKSINRLLRHISCRKYAETPAISSNKWVKLNIEFSLKTFHWNVFTGENRCLIFNH